ncbi:Tat protein [Rhizobium sp. Leaf321]|uniref:TIGR03808 family TAT-translocated repetitive protein n=1 Tax=Rhizobium sp. Leaf321 TaxID=1736335 RepID=UPI0007147EB1|nr:TIGR03808 family TAT-translocated repetitive protein [Rhizobium sp. Leaf321]KQQ74010.1 Tat protein [Rhizobium sp. Leaf321]
MISRRKMLGWGMTGAAVAALPLSALAAPASVSTVDLRGSIDARDHGVSPDGGDVSSRKLMALIEQAARQNKPVYLPPGDYRVSGLDLPDNTRLVGVSGASRLVYSGDGSLIRATAARRIELSNLVIDGGNRWLDDQTPALIHFSGIPDVSIDNCEILGARKSAIQLERCGGRIERSKISGAADYAVYAVESTGLSVTGNSVFDCGNGGILIHRWEKGVDGSIVTANRIFRIGARNGGTGQYGNAINLFRAANVMVSGNHITDSAFSAIRANSSSNAQISGNQCFRSGETAIYAEFSFEGAVISDNTVDGAANGISVVNFNEGGRLSTISGNIVRNLSATGPYKLDGAIFGVGISAEADTAITGNVVENAALWGLALGFGPYLRNVVAANNIVRGANVGCAVSVAEGAGSTVITGNVFQDVNDGGVIGYRWTQAPTEELGGSGDAAAAFPHLTVMGNRVG